MTAESDIAALSDGGANPISEIRTALTSVLARADTFKLIETVTLGADGTITFSSIPAGFKDLVIVGLLRDDDASDTVNAINLRVGNTSVDTGSNYGYFAASIRGDSGANVTSYSASATAALAGRTCVANGATAGRFSPIRLEILNYSTTGAFRNYMSESTDWYASGNARHSVASGEWQNTADAIDVVQILGDSLGDFKAGSTLTLYGRG